jgi:hypothetical protein
MQTVVHLSNHAPQMQAQVPVVGEDGQVTLERRSVRAAHLTDSVTTVTMRPDFDDADEVELALSTRNDPFMSLLGAHLTACDPALRKYTAGVAECESIMQAHAVGERPRWVWSSDPEFVRALAEHFGAQIGEPVSLLTSVGRDALHKQHMDTAAQPAAFNYIALSANVTTPSTASTTLPGEITTAGGGLLRAQGTFAHTTGTNTSTLTKTFTANGSDSLPVTVAKAGMLNAASVGTLGYETLLNAAVTLTISGDSFVFTETLTAG